MALKTIMLRRSIDLKKAQLEELREKDADFLTREAELEAAIAEAGTEDEQAAVGAVADHTHEVLALFHRGAGDALVGEDARHGPHGVGHDLVGVVFFLHLVAVCLILLLGGDPAVGGDPELSL